MAEKPDAPIISSQETDATTYFCPVSGLPVFTCPDWRQRKVSKHLTANFYLVGDCILYSRPEGSADLPSTRASLQLNQEVARHLREKTAGYIQIEDYAQLDKAGLDSRRHFIEQLDASPGLVRVIFCNLSSWLNLFVKLGKRLTRRMEGIHLVRDYPEAIQLALTLASQEGLWPGPFVFGRPLAYRTDVPVLKPVELRHDHTWDLAAEGFGFETCLIDHCLLHVSPYGLLQSGHLPLVAEKHRLAREKLSAMDSFDYVVLEVSRLEGKTQQDRRLFLTFFRKWQGRFAFRMFIIYGTNSVKRLLIRLVNLFVPFNLYVARDLDHVFQLVRADQQGQAQSRPASPTDLLTTYRRQLLQYIESIDWGQSGFNDDLARQDRDHPFYDVFQAVRLMKREMDDLIVTREKMQASLEQSEQKYRRLFQDASDFLYTHDLNGNLLETNAIFKKEYGWPDRMPRDLNVRDLIPERYRSGFGDYLQRIQSAGRDQGTMLITVAEGREIVLEYNNVLVKDDDGRILFVQGAARDITERKQAEKALRKNAALLQAITDNISDLVSVATLEGKFLYVSGSHRQLGYAPEELVGQMATAYVHPEDLPRIRAQISEALDRLETTQGVYRYQTREGRYVWLETFGSFIFDGEGRSTSILFSSRDITERKKAEAQKKRLEAQLRQSQKMEAVGTLAGGIAHNFNNVLMAIQGRVSLLMDDYAPSAEEMANLKEIEECVASAAELTKDLLGFARGGKYQVRPVDLNELIKHENRMFGRTRKEVRVQGKYDPQPCIVEADPGQIRQALINLYVNAWQAMPEGGDLYVQTRNLLIDADYVRPFEIQPGRYICISVTDTGAGMDEATREKIFDPFFTTKEAGVGTGLGLASVYGIIKNHGGVINVYSEKHQGTTFNIYLPASEKPVKIETPVSSPAVKGHGQMLLVDDEKMILDIGAKMLERLGYQALTAGSGQEAVALYQKHQDTIRFVILDMIMPDQGGGTTYDQLKTINPRLKVILSSGYSLNGQAREIMERGCDGFIQKPFNLKELSGAIGQVLENG